MQNELKLRREGELYIFRFDAADRKELVKLLGRFAANEELNFTWKDAAVLAQRSRLASGAERVEQR